LMFASNHWLNSTAKNMPDRHKSDPACAIGEISTPKARLVFLYLLSLLHQGAYAFHRFVCAQPAGKQQEAAIVLIVTARDQRKEFILVIYIDRDIEHGALAHLGDIAIKIRLRIKIVPLHIEIRAIVRIHRGIESGI